MKNAIVSTGESTKFQNRYKGPLVITRIHPGDTYGVAALKVENQRRRYASTAHASQLKLWIPTPDENEEEIGNLEMDDEEEILDDEILPVQEKEMLISKDEKFVEPVRRSTRKRQQTQHYQP